MIQVKLIKAISGHREADTINVTLSSAAFLVGAGYAERITAETTPGTSKPKGRPRKTQADPLGGDSPPEDRSTAG